MVDNDRRRGDQEILHRLAHIEERQRERWTTTRETLERLSVIETRQMERWAAVQSEFQKISQRLSSVEELCKAMGRSNSSSFITAMTPDVKILLVIVLVAGAAMGRAGINPIEWILG